MKIIVTGSEGFIGKNLTARLLEEGHEVICWDTKIAKDIFNQSVSNFDVAYHLACVNQEEALGLPMLNLHVNAYGARYMASLCKRYNAKLIYTSTASVYGNAEEFPTPKTSRLHPLTDYAIAKLAGENYVKISGCDYLIYRLSNVYGPHQTTENPYCGVVAKFIEAAEAGNPLNIIGDGTQTRDFTFVDDVIDELIDPQWATGIKNISRGVETSVLDLAAAVHGICGFTGTVKAEKRPIDGISRRVLLSNVTCPTVLEQGLIKSVEWYRAQNREGRSNSVESGRSTALSR